MLDGHVQRMAGYKTERALHASRRSIIRTLKMNAEALVVKVWSKATFIIEPSFSA